MNPTPVIAHLLPGQPGTVRAAGSLAAMCDNASAGIAESSRPEPRWGA